MESNTDPAEFMMWALNQVLIPCHKKKVVYLHIFAYGFLQLFWRAYFD